MKLAAHRFLNPNLIRKLRPLAHTLLGSVAPAGWLVMRSQPQFRENLAREQLTAISANLWHDWPKYRDLLPRLEVFAHLVEKEGADLLLLQEVSRSRQVNVDEWLSHRLGMAYVYSRANGHQAGIGFEEGLAVFSRFRLSRPVLRQLSAPSQPFTRRLALGAEVRTPWGNLLAISVHLGLIKKGNGNQIDRLREWVTETAQDTPALIGGDFNAPEYRRGIVETRRLWQDTYRQKNPDSAGATHVLRWPWGGIMARHRLDYIFLRQVKPAWRVAETRHLTSPGLPYSDHLAVLTRLVSQRTDQITAGASEAALKAPYVLLPAPGKTRPSRL